MRTQPPSIECTVVRRLDACFPLDAKCKSRRGGRRSAMPSQFENPMMISLFENNNVCHDCFSHSERLRMLIRGGWRVANGEWGRRTDYSRFAIGKAAVTKPAGAGDARPIGRAARLPLVERARA